MRTTVSSTATSAQHRRHLRGKAVVAACVVAAALGGSAGSASAASTTTKWYSINQQPAGASSPQQFLTATSTGQVTLTSYQSGEWRQQWRPVYPEWPMSPTITSNSPLKDFFSTIADCVVNLGCPFTGRAGGQPRKYVNRMYARCMSFKPTGSVTTKVVIESCGGSGMVLKRQVFSWQFSESEVAARGIPQDYTPIHGMRGGSESRCLDSTGGSNAPGTNAAALACGGSAASQPWRQQFRFLNSDSQTCKQFYPGTLCGLGAPVSSQP